MDHNASELAHPVLYKSCAATRYGLHIYESPGFHFMYSFSSKRVQWLAASIGPCVNCAPTTPSDPLLLRAGPVS
jgi:hypothetical protein